MKNSTPRLLATIAFVLFIGCGLLLIRERRNDPEHVFYSMLKNNLSSQGVSRTVTQEGGGQTLVQTTQLQTGEQNVASSQTELIQGSEDSKTVIVTESIGTPTEDFIRYSRVETDQLGATGQPLDFSKVTGTWGQSMSGDGIERGGEVFGESTLGIVPFGFINREQTEELLSSIRSNDVYGIDFSQVESSELDGRPTYVYHAEIKPDQYVRMLQQFSSYIGTTQLDQLNAESFVSNQPIKIDFEIDIWSQQLRKATFVDGQREETYTSYGLRQEVLTPTESITVNELQRLLQSVQ